jgi:hypothetical protein
MRLLEVRLFDAAHNVFHARLDDLGARRAVDSVRA